MPKTKAPKKNDTANLGFEAQLWQGGGMKLLTTWTQSIRQSKQLQ